MERYDLAIVGGGLAGSLLALALAPLALKIVLLEARPLHNKPISDGRSLALSHSSVNILKAIGIWDEIADLATPIEQVHVSSQGTLGLSRLNAKEVKVPALGYVIPIHEFHQAVTANIINNSLVNTLCPAEVQGLEQNDQEVILKLKSDESVIASIVLAADGTQSSLRKLLGISVTETDYHQTAIVANVELQRSHHSIAYERFTRLGPIAMLPLKSKVAMIWTASPELTQSRMALSDTDFLQALQDAFGYRLGRLKGVWKRDTFPLKMVLADKQQCGRVLLFGNAAHSLHPVAGQGFNLTLRDIAILAEVIAENKTCDPEIFSRYVALRQDEQLRMIKITDGLVRLFSGQKAPISWIRDLAMRQFERTPIAKNWFNRVMMGKSGNLPKLARGLSLYE